MGHNHTAGQRSSGHTRQAPRTMVPEGRHNRSPVNLSPRFQNLPPPPRTSQTGSARRPAWSKSPFYGIAGRFPPPLLETTLLSVRLENSVPLTDSRSSGDNKKGPYRRSDTTRQLGCHLEDFRTKRLQRVAVNERARPHPKLGPWFAAIANRSRGELEREGVGNRRHCVHAEGINPRLSRCKWNT